MPRLVVPISSGPSCTSDCASRMRCPGITGWALPEMRRPATDRPRLSSSSSSSHSVAGSSTTPLPRMQSLPGSRMPEGSNRNLNVSVPTTTVCPAFEPPWYRATISNCSASRSTTLPLPSSPHWAPTITVPDTSGLPAGEVGEQGVLLPERELDGVGGAGAVLRDDQLRDALVRLRVLDVVLVAIDEHDDVGVLLDGVVDDHVVRDEVVKLVDGQVVDELGAGRFDRGDRVPVDVGRRERPQLGRSNDGRDAAGALAAHARPVEGRAGGRHIQPRLERAARHAGGVHGRDDVAAPDACRDDVAIGVRSDTAHARRDCRHRLLPSGPDRPDLRTVSEDVVAP